MFGQKFLATFGFGLVFISALAAQPPQVENKVPLFPLGEEYREAAPSASSPTPLPPPTRSERFPSLLKQLPWDVLFAPFQLLLPPAEL